MRKFFLKPLSFGCFALLCFQSALAQGNYKLIFALDLIRHGDRTPARYMPEISNAWTEEEIGRLTPLGIKNSELLGNQLRKYYVEEERLLPKKYDAHLMHVSATHVHRAQDTAKYILQGFYPKNHADIQIEVPAENKDVLLRSEKQQPELKKVVMQTADEKFLNDKEAVYEDGRLALKELNTMFGTKFEKWIDVAHFCDLSKVSKIHGKPLLKTIDSDKLENICKAGVKIGWAHFEADPRVRCLHAKPFMLHVAEVIQNQNSEDAKVKYMLYVAHDTNIIASTLLMGRPLDGTPPYLSDLRFELFKNSKTGVNFVKASLNGEPIKICAEAMCPAEEFISTLRARLEDQCGNENTGN